MSFDPIAIVGQSCVLPGALNPKELVDLVINGKDVLSSVTEGYWRTDPKLVLTDSPKNAVDQTWCDRGGYVRGFESVFDPEGFSIPAEEIKEYDPLVQWVLHTSREALRDAGCLGSNLKTGVIFGNLSYPSHGLTQFAESIWLDAQSNDFLNGKARELAGINRPNPMNRFMSGLPAHIVARALDIEGGAFALDAACASSLYAMKLACDKLHDREADLMLAGGVNRSDDLIIHIGFCVLQAMSHTGQSRPFHNDADGLVPAEGAGFVALKRLDDAVAAGDTIHGVIRSIGLANDGRGHGLLVPSDEGQARSMQLAYDLSGLAPSDISLIECHATGTMIGDSIELRSMSKIFEGLSNIPIGTIKSNMGHPITVSGIAGLLKVLGAIKEQVLPKTLHVEKPLDEIKNTPFRLLTKNEPWESDKPRIAAISNFGFGGNNAHLIVEEWDESAYKPAKKRKALPKDEIAIIGMGAIVADAIGKDAFARTLFSGNSRLRNQYDGRFGAFTETIDLPLLGLNFPPADLEQTLPQQLLILKSTMEAMSEVKNLPTERTCLFAGMGCDAEVSRGALGWKLKQLVKDWTGETGLSNMEDWISKAKGQVNPYGKAPAVLGAMPNIVANRLSSQFDITGPAFSVSSEELSGIRAINLAIRSLRAKESDAAVVGAVDICCEPVHETAAREVLSKEKHVPGDAAITLILKRLKDAQEDGDNIYAIITDEIDTEPKFMLGSEENQINLEQIFGHAHAASGMLYVAAAALACYYKLIPAGEGKKAVPWLASHRSMDVPVNALGGESAIARLKEDNKNPTEAFFLKDIPNLHIYSGKNRKEVLQNLEAGNESDSGPSRLVLVAINSQNHSNLKNIAKTVLEKGDFKDHIDLANGIFYRDKPIEGELAFVFTGSAGVYAGMGRELIMGFPEIIDIILTRFGSLEAIPGWIYDINNDITPTAEEMLWGSTFLCQVHAGISQQILGIVPDAVLGFSSGESNSLFAMGVWDDIDNMAREFHKKKVLSREVGGEFVAIKKAWKKHKIKKVDWTNWMIRASKEEVLSAIESEPLVHLIIINSPKDMVIGGLEEACDRIIDKLGRNRAFRLPYNVANHCPEIEAYADEWRELHHRKTNTVPNIRFYSVADYSHYQPTAESAAEALLKMATQRLDFPRLVESAWNDGVRIFLELGPRDSCSRWIKETLGDKEYLAIPMDIGGKSAITQLIHAMAQLKAAGVSVNEEEIASRKILMNQDVTQEKQEDNSLKKKTKTYLVHPPLVQFPPIIAEQKDDQKNDKNETKPIAQNKGVRMQESNKTHRGSNQQKMAPAPYLPPVIGQDEIITENLASEAEYIPNSPNPQTAPKPISMPEVELQSRSSQQSNIPGSNILKVIIEQNSMIASAHQEFLNQSARIYQQFIEHRDNAFSILMDANGNSLSSPSYEEGLTMPVQSSVDIPQPAQQSVDMLQVKSDIPIETFKTPSLSETTNEISVKAKEQSVPQIAPLPIEQVKEEKPVLEAEVDEKSSASIAKPVEKKEPIKSKDGSREQVSAMDALKKQFENPVELPPVGPAFSREQLKILASGKISEVFGPLFEQQDGYELQVRLPEEPLLLVDRITGIDAEPGSMGKGVMWTETDVTKGAWYLNDIYMPGGVTIESGQCDLTLISYLGIDFFNKGERVYRLLGCDLMYYGSPPKVGETLCYQIHIDGHANMGDTRIFFFRYDCRINGELRLSVRNAQAGFFTYDQLKQSGGVLWEPETAEHKPDDEARVDPPYAVCKHNKFSKEQVHDFSEGRAYECFGEEFEILASHSKTPKLPADMMLLIQEVAEFDPKGGPWKRGYIRVENDIKPDDWYLPGHFKNDPCMPGTLMSDACMQVLGFYLAAMGYTIQRDGWRLDPVPDEVFQAKCRGQVSTTSKKLVYEAFIEEVIDGPYPTVYADLLATVDGLKCLHIRRLGVRIVPDFPLDCWPHLLEGYVEKKPVAKFGDFEFGYRSLMACAFGKPSEAFGDLGKHFDSGRHIARLPGPPYHFMTRLSRIDATMAAMKSSGEVVEVEYDIPPDAWYFDKNGNRTMPFCVLMEVALQPCGWLAVFEGGVGISREPLLFRNLDGSGIQHAEILPDTGTILTRSKLTNIAQMKGVALFNFDVECFVGDTLVYTMKTGFGFFLREAFEQQLGIPMTEEKKVETLNELREPSDFMVDLTKRPERYCSGELRLPEQMLLMLDRVTGYWPKGGEKGIGRLRGEKDVDIHEWFFKAHFFHDPVQPGSLGVEAIIQLLQFYMLHENMHEGIKNPRFESLAIGKPISWKYRGQVVPKNYLIDSELNVIEVGRDEEGSFAVAEGWLWVDDLRIYHVKDIVMRIVSGDPS